MAVSLALAATLGGAAVFWSGAWLASTSTRLPDADGHAAGRPALATVLLARDGTEIARYYHENRTWTPLRKIGTPVRQALLATEDHRFYAHGGVDVRRLASSAWQTLARGNRQGGSTITMQLVRNRYPAIAAAPPYERKAKELLMALKLERAFGKREVLEAYLNTVPFGHGAHGIGAAARTYFDTTAAALGPARAALLVALLKGPTRYSPTAHPERARQRRNLVLRQMQRRGFLAEERRVRLQATPLRLALHRPTLASSPAPHFAEAVRRRAERWAAARGRSFYTGGLRIHTTLDPAMQKQARQAVRTQARKLEAVAAYEWSHASPRLLSEKIAPYVEHAEAGEFVPFARLFDARPALARHHARRTARYRAAVRGGTAPGAALRRLLDDPAFADSLRRRVARLRAGLVAVEPGTAAVRAYVGGREYARDQYDKVGLARRQPGSTFKPFVWGAALEHGFAPYDAMQRDGTLPRPFAGRRPPLQTGGLTLRDGLAYSSNRMAAALTRAVGPAEVARLARRLGIQSELRAVPSLALGTSEVRLLELTAAYAALADGGRPQPPRLITRITDARGETLAAFPPPQQRRALAPHTAYTLLDLMRGVVDRGTGHVLRSGWPMRGADLAGKTGTTQGNADGWFLAVHPRLAVGAWTGFDDRRVAFRTEHWGHGASNALRLVGAFLGKTFAARPAWAQARFTPPTGYHRPRPPRTAALDTAYTGYETAGGAYGTAPAATDRRLRDAVGQGLRATRPGLGSGSHADSGTGSHAPAAGAPAPVRARDLDRRFGRRRDSLDG